MGGGGRGTVVATAAYSILRALHVERSNGRVSLPRRIRPSTLVSDARMMPDALEDEFPSLRTALIFIVLATARCQSESPWLSRSDAIVCRVTCPTRTAQLRRRIGDMRDRGQLRSSSAREAAPSFHRSPTIPIFSCRNVGASNGRISESDLGRLRRERRGTWRTGRSAARAPASAISHLRSRTIGGTMRRSLVNNASGERAERTAALQQPPVS